MVWVVHRFYAGGCVMMTAVDLRSTTGHQYAEADQWKQKKHER